MAASDQRQSQPADSGQDLNSIISSNLRRLISQKGTTQKELADKLGVTESSMTDYCRGRRLPGAVFFVALKNLYDISIDDFLTKSITPSAGALPARESQTDRSMLSTYRKYCGLYFVYYFDTTKYKGRDTLPPRDSVLFGVLYIYENPSSLRVSEFSCAAVLGFKDRKNVSFVKKTLGSLADPAKIVDYIDSKYPNTAYHGDFELSQEHAFISMRHASTDKALIIFHRVDSNKPEYTGGIGTVNSVSKGRERAPVIQFMGISRSTLEMSVEEIHHCLLLNYPTFKAESEADEMIRNFRALFTASDGEEKGFSEYQKKVMIRSALERYIKKSLERNMFRYGKISERDDDEWYHAVKKASVKEPR